METIRTKGFTVKDEFNSANATPIKAVKNSVITVKDVMVKDKTTGETVGFLKGDDDTIYATISDTVIEQLVALAPMVESNPQDVLVVPKTSNGGREYFMLELQ